MRVGRCGGWYPAATAVQSPCTARASPKSTTCPVVPYAASVHQDTAVRYAAPVPHVVLGHRRSTTRRFSTTWSRSSWGGWY
eukprot:344296-Rhodomonas_salina.1